MHVSRILMLNRKTKNRRILMLNRKTNRRILMLNRKTKNPKTKTITTTWLRDVFFRSLAMPNHNTFRSLSMHLNMFRSWPMHSLNMFLSNLNTLLSSLNRLLDNLRHNKLWLVCNNRKLLTNLLEDRLEKIEEYHQRDSRINVFFNLKSTC